MDLISNPSPWATEVYRGPGFVLGKFECPAHASSWDEENWIGNHPHVVFPQVPVLIELRGHEVVSDPNMVVLYDGGQTYRRRKLDPRGDRCFYAEVSEELVGEMLGPPSGRAPGFPEVSAPVDARVYALQWRALRAYEEGTSDDLALDEGVLALLGLVIGRVNDHVIDDRSGHRRIVEGAKRVLNETLTEHLTLAQISALVHVSPFHLTRLFHRYTGMPLHRYRTQLRLREALGRLEDGRPVREIAAATGFSSHSHFTARFRRAFGFTPVEWRHGALHPCDLLPTSLAAPNA